MEIGPVALELTGTVESEEESFGGERMGAMVRIYDVVGPSFAAQLGDVVLDNGESHVRLLDRGPTRKLDRLERGARIGVRLHRRARWVMDLTLLAPGKNDRDTSHPTTLDELDKACGFSARDVLLAHGASGVGPRETTIGDTGRMRRGLCVTFDDRESHVPAVAYVLTRVLYYC